MRRVVAGVWAVCLLAPIVAAAAGRGLPLVEAVKAGDVATVRALLNELASEIGSILEQEEVYVGYRDRTWTLKSQ